MRRSKTARAISWRRPVNDMRFVFLDLDDTLLDFGAAEHEALQKTLREEGIAPSAEVVSRYRAINRRYWEALERGEVTREQLFVGRFREFFAALGVKNDPEACNRRYLSNLALGHSLMDGAKEILDYLSEKYELYLASNGVAATQYMRLKSADLTGYFRQIFISETTGFHKPERGYFDYCFARIENFDPRKAIIVGDSLTSDILGGKNAGIATCWFNPAKKPARADIRPDYEICALAELKAIL